MKMLKISLLVFSVILTACHSYTSKDYTDVKVIQVPQPEGRALPGTKTAVNQIYLVNGEKPQVIYDKVAIGKGERLIFVGPTDFKIEFKKGSFFVDQNPDLPNVYRSENGILILTISPEKTARLKYGTTYFKYSIFVNGKELDPLAGYIKDD